MKRLVLIFLLIVPYFSYSQRALSDKQWTEDLNFMIHRIDSIHPRFCTPAEKEQIQKKARELKAEIPSLSDNEIIVSLLRLITTVHDGHTRLHGKNLTKKWYPVRIEKFIDGYFITAIAKEHSKFIGAKVLTINNLPVEQVFEKLKAITPHDNAYGQAYFAPMYLTMSSILSGLHITKSPDDSLILGVAIQGRQDKKLVLSPTVFQTRDDLSWFWKDYGVPAKEYSNILGVDSMLPLYLQKYDQPFWFTFIKEKSTVYFDFNACVNDEKYDFERFNRKLWKCIDSVKAKYLVIDLRNNFGGTNSHLMPLVHEIIKHDRINRKGHLFVIIGKKTFSAALDCATWIEFQCHPIFAGEPTGAGPNHDADPDFSLLPNSKILLMVSKYYWQDSWPWDDRKFIDPTIKGRLSSEDYFHFRDPVLDEIFRYIKQHQQKSPVYNTAS